MWFITIERGTCGIQYVCETKNDARESVRNHRFTIKLHVKHTDKPMVSHFSCHNDSFTVTVIECLSFAVCSQKDFILTL